jgi:ribosomal protein S15P/S13E
MDNKLHQTFQQTSTSASNLKVSGLKSESAYDSKSKTGYAIVYAKRTDLSNYYNEVVKRNLAQITEKIGTITKMIDANSRDEALRLISECQTLFAKRRKRKRFWWP